jgi:hypothetical protein
LKKTAERIVADKYIQHHNGQKIVMTSSKTSLGGITTEQSLPLLTVKRAVKIQTCTMTLWKALNMPISKKVAFPPWLAKECNGWQMCTFSCNMGEHVIVSLARWYDVCIIVSLMYVNLLLTYIHQISTCRQKSTCSNCKKHNIIIVAAKGLIGYYKFSNHMVWRSLNMAREKTPKSSNHGCNQS